MDKKQILDKMEELQCQINKQVEQLEELKKMVENTNAHEYFWTPAYGDKYYYVDEYNEVVDERWQCVDVDEIFLTSCNVFKTKEEAVAESEKRIITCELKRFAIESGEIDLSDFGQYKYYLYYDRRENSLGCNCTHGILVQGVIYFTSSESINKAVDSIGKNRIKKYLFGIDV